MPKQEKESNNEINAKETNKKKEKMQMICKASKLVRHETSEQSQLWNWQINQKWKQRSHQINYN